MKFDTTNRKTEVGIATFMFGENFGCFLQRYAMQKVLKLRFGLGSKLINYVPPLFRPGKFRFRHLFNRKTYVNIVLSFWNQRPKLFAKFGRTFTDQTEKINDETELAKLTERFSVFLTGSDQVWNPWACLNDEGYRFFMLGFAPEGTKIAYAPSLGVSEVNAKFENAARKYLPSFNWLSVRENDGSEIVSRILNRNIDVVLDPTLLLSLEDWNEVSAAARPLSVKNKRYILCYALANFDPVVRMAAEAGKRLGDPDIALLCAAPKEYSSLKRQFKNPKIKIILHAGPAEFVNLVKNAELVVTDSFHGSVFALIYQKPFWTMMRDKNPATTSMNSRITTLFANLELESRLFEPEVISRCAEEDPKIDYRRVNKLLEPLKEESIRKLDAALSSVLDRN